MLAVSAAGPRIAIDLYVFGGIDEGQRNVHYQIGVLDAARIPRRWYGVNVEWHRSFFWGSA